MKGSTSKRVLGGALALALIIASPFAVKAAGNFSYSPPAGSGSGNPGGYTSVIGDQTVCNAGGTYTIVASSGSVTVTVPSGAFPSCAELVVTQGECSDITSASYPDTACALAIGVTFDSTTTGDPISGSFPAVTLTFSDSAITSSSDVVEFDTSTDTFVPFTGATLGAGTATLTITSDPSFAILAAAATTVPSAGSAQLENIEIPAGLAFAAGILLLAAFGFRRRQSSAL